MRALSPAGLDLCPSDASITLTGVRSVEPLSHEHVRPSRTAGSAAPDLRSRSDRLDLVEGIGAAGLTYLDPFGGRCVRWPEKLGLVNVGTGELVRGRCKATNLCHYCRGLYLRETVRMLQLDAEVSPPTLFAVLTAREFLRKGDGMKRLLSDSLLRPLRRRWPVEWFCRWEHQARGALHLNLLVKGVAVEAWRDFERELFGLWCANVDALPKGQYVEPVSSGEAVTVYVANKVAHAGKSNQEPQGWRWHHRTSQTRGYLHRSAAELRRDARAALAAEAIAFRRGLTPEVARLEVAAGAATWSLVACVPWSAGSVPREGPRGTAE